MASGKSEDHLSSSETTIYWRHTNSRGTDIKLVLTVSNYILYCAPIGWLKVNLACDWPIADL